MKIGIVSDIHCNHEALRIALDRMGDVDELLCAGDAVYQFRFSNEVMAVLRERGARYILGNHEDVLLGKGRARALCRLGAAVRTGAHGVAGVPPARDARQREVAGDGARQSVGAVQRIHLPHSPAISRLGEIGADYVVLGHTHYQMAERVGRSLIINPGSAGEPRDPATASSSRTRSSTPKRTRSSSTTP
jgi:putative phosphoesterase